MQQPNNLVLPVFEDGGLGVGSTATFNGSSRNTCVNVNSSGVLGASSEFLHSPYGDFYASVLATSAGTLTIATTWNGGTNWLTSSLPASSTTATVANQPITVHLNLPPVLFGYAVRVSWINGGSAVTVGAFHLVSAFICNAG
jgi:hypothetical protein